MKNEPVNQCSPRGEELTAYLLGELADNAADAVRRHVESCAACRERMRELQRTLDLARDALTDPALASEIVAELSRDRRERLLQAPRRAGILRVLESRWFLSAAAAAAAIMIGWVFSVWRFSRRPENGIRTYELAVTDGQTANRVATVGSAETTPVPPPMSDETASALAEGIAAVPDGAPVLAMDRRENAVRTGADTPVFAGKPAGPAEDVLMSGDAAVAADTAEMSEPPPAAPPALAARAVSRVAANEAEKISAFSSHSPVPPRADVAAALSQEFDLMERLRIPPLPTGQRTAREAVEWLKAVVAAVPGGERIEIAAVVESAHGPTMLTHRAYRQFRKGAGAAPPHSPGPASPRVTAPVVEPADTLPLKAVVVELAERYGLRFRFTDRGVEFFLPESDEPQKMSGETP